MSIEYAAHESTPDTTWTAGPTGQSIHQALPGGVSYTNQDGSQVSGENPVNAAPSVWVDANGDGGFTLDECVHNCPPVMRTARSQTWARRWSRATRSPPITINRTLEPGEYKARTLGRRL